MMADMTSHTDKFFRNHHDHTEEGGKLVIVERISTRL